MLSSQTRLFPPPTPAMPKQYFAKIDNIKALVIILVIVGHAIDRYFPADGPWRWLYSIIYTFHMPVFIFVSGYLSSSKKSFIDFTRDLFLLYVVAQVLWSLFIAILYPFTHSTNGLFSFLLINPAWGFWYLLSLYFWRITTPLLSSIRFPKITLLALCTLPLLVGLYGSLGETLALSRTLAFFPVFAAGFWSRSNNWSLTNEKPRLTDLLAIPLGIIAACFIFPQAYAAVLQPFFNTSYSIMGISAKQGMLFRAAMFPLLYAAIRLLFLLTPSGQNFLTRIGASTLAIYIVHFYVIHLFATFIPASSWLPALPILIPILVILSCTIGIFLKPDRLFSFLKNRLASLLFKSTPSQQ